MLVASGMSWTLQTRCRVWMSGSWGWALSGSTMKITAPTSPAATRAAICASPPSGPDSTHSTSSPVASAIRLPVVPVATSCQPSRAWRLRWQNAVRASFLVSCAISAMTAGGLRGLERDWFMQCSSCRGHGRPAEAFVQPDEFRRQRRRDSQLVLGIRMPEHQPLCEQQQPMDAELLSEQPVVSPFAMRGVADQRMEDVGEVLADLVSAPGFRLYLHQGVAGGGVTA